MHSKNEPAFFQATLKLIFLAVLLTIGTGCVATSLPISRVEYRHEFKPRQIEFLKDRPLSRAEVVATLGAPWGEIEEDRILIYTWSRATPHGGLILVPPAVFGPITVIEPTDHSKVRGLFIAYDTEQNILAHEICIFREMPDLKAEAAKWLKGKLPLTTAKF